MLIRVNEQSLYTYYVFIVCVQQIKRAEKSDTLVIDKPTAPIDMYKVPP